jgi:uncharacterized DUF497 family protein
MHIFMHTINTMEFTCNAVKNATNVRDRGLPLLAARLMFNPAMLVREDKRKTYPERRFVGYNTVEGRLMVVVFCCPAPLHTHIISFRKANDRERKKFEAQSL